MITKNIRRKWLKRLLLGTFATFLLLILLALIFEKAIGRRVLNEVNHHLRSELHAGEVSLSLIWSFPSVTLDLKNVSLNGTDNKPMFKAAHLRFAFGLFSLFSNKIEIQSVIAENGALLLCVQKNGKTNYDIVKPSEEKSENDVAFVLKKAVLEDITIGYENVVDNQNIGLTINNATFKGAFSANNFELKSEADLRSHGLTFGKNTFLQNNTISYVTAIKVDLEKKFYEIQQFELDIEKNKFDVSGTAKMTKNSTALDLDIAGKNCNLATLLQLLPAQYRSQWVDFQSDGTITAQASVKGTLGKNTMPAIHADLELHDGSLRTSKLADALDNINFKVNFTNGAAHNASSSVLSMPDFRGTFAKQPLELQLNVKNFDQPYIDFFMNGKIPITSVYGFLVEKSSEGSGFLTLEKISVQGFLEDMKNINRVPQVKMSGSVAAEQVSLTVPQGRLNVPEGTVVFDNNTIAIQQLNLEGLDNSIVLNGTVSNFLPVFLSDSTDTKAKLNFDAKLDASKINLNKLLAATTSTDKKTNTSTKSNGKKTKKPFYSYLAGTFQSDIKAFEYQRFMAKNCLGLLQFEEDNININGNVETMGGVMQLKGRLALQQAPDLHATMTCSKIDAPTFFYQCENFGQSILTHQNIKGLLNARMVIDAQWDNYGNFLDKKMVAYAYLNVQNGLLQNFKMLEDFSTFVKIEDLKNIKFTNLENWFEIRDGWMYMPVMELRNNALNMSVSGSHSFENDINYNIKVNAAQVVINRFRKFNNRLSPQKDVEDEGFFDLYFNMKGTLDKYEIEQAKTYVKGEFERGLLRRKDIQTKLNASMNGKDYALQEKMLFKAEKSDKNTNTTHNAIAIKKDNTPVAKNFVLPKNYKPKKPQKDELGNELLEGF